IQIWCIIASLHVGGQCDYFTDITTGCSSKCSVTTNKDLSCFNKTLEYFERTLFGIMRNYVASQLNLASLPSNHVALTGQQIVSSTLDVMATVHSANIEDEKGLLTVDGTRPIVEALVNDVMSKPRAMYNYVCPQGCERSNTPWLWYFIASAATNLSLIAFGIFAVMQNHRKTKKLLKHVQKGPTNANMKTVKQN
ncbi:hypothetical protein COOONC_03342, partial [Cooperia oncophora]